MMHILRGIGLTALYCFTWIAVGLDRILHRVWTRARPLMFAAMVAAIVLAPMVAVAWETRR